MSQVRRSGRRSGAGSAPWAEPPATAEEERSPAAGGTNIRVRNRTTSSPIVVAASSPVDGVEIERITGTTVMPTLHGCFSLGTVVGAVCGIAATAQRLPAHWHLLAVTCVSLAVFLYAIKSVPAGTGVHTRGSATREAPDEFAREMWRDSLVGTVLRCRDVATGRAGRRAARRRSPA